jgi:hypothetical protein
MTPPPAEPFTEYLWVDILRCIIIAAALLLVALMLRLTWDRHRRRATEPDRYDAQVHPFTMLSYALSLVLSAAHRYFGLGHPWTWYIGGCLVAVVLGYIGVFSRVSVTLIPPWRSRR